MQRAGEYEHKKARNLAFRRLAGKQAKSKQAGGINESSKTLRIHPANCEMYANKKSRKKQSNYKNACNYGCMKSSKKKGKQQAKKQVNHRNAYTHVNKKAGKQASGKQEGFELS